MFGKMIEGLKKVGRKIAKAVDNKAVEIGVGVSTIVASASARAELPTEVTGAFTAVTGNWTSMSTLIWGLLVAITGGFALMKMFKKGLSRAI